MEAQMIADAIAVLSEMDGTNSPQATNWIRRAQAEITANPKANGGIAVQHLLRAAWYQGYRAYGDEVA